jgi:hypothetical protein
MSKQSDRDAAQCWIPSSVALRAPRSSVCTAEDAGAVGRAAVAVGPASFTFVDEADLGEDFADEEFQAVVH